MYTILQKQQWCRWTRKITVTRTRLKNCHIKTRKQVMTGFIWQQVVWHHCDNKLISIQYSILITPHHKMTGNQLNPLRGTKQNIFFKYENDEHQSTEVNHWYNINLNVCLLRKATVMILMWSEIVFSVTLLWLECCHPSWLPSVPSFYGPLFLVCLCTILVTTPPLQPLHFTLQHSWLFL